MQRGKVAIATNGHIHGRQYRSEGFHIYPCVIFSQQISIGRVGKRRSAKADINDEFAKTNSRTINCVIIKKHHL